MSTLDSVRSSSPSAWAGGGASVRPREVSTAERSAAWFNEPVLEGSRLLRAPAAGGQTSPQALTERFLACLCEG